MVKSTMYKKWADRVELTKKKQVSVIVVPFLQKRRVKNTKNVSSIFHDSLKTEGTIDGSDFDIHYHTFTLLLSSTGTLPLSLLVLSRPRIGGTFLPRFSAQPPNILGLSQRLKLRNTFLLFGQRLLRGSYFPTEVFDYGVRVS